MKFLTLSFFLVFTLSRVSVANENYCEISKYLNYCESGQIILLENDYLNSSSVEDKIAKHCSFNHVIVELGDKNFNDQKYLCIHK